MSSDDRNNRVQKLFLSALEIPEDQRDAWLTEQCGEDKQLLAEVRSLLQHYVLTKDPLEQGLSPSNFSNLDLKALDSNQATHASELESPLANDDAGRQASSDKLPFSATTALESSRPSSQQIGPYKLLQQIGEGGMGTVWMAEQEKPIRRRVALKLIKSGMDSRRWWRGLRPSARRWR